MGHTKDGASVDRLGNEVPAAALPFAHWLEERGWHYLREYVPAGEYEDEDGSTVTYEAFWEETIWHELPAAWPREEGIWFYSMTVSRWIIGPDDHYWQFFLDFARECSERERISCRVPFTPEEVNR